MASMEPLCVLMRLEGLPPRYRSEPVPAEHFASQIGVGNEGIGHWDDSHPVSFESVDAALAHLDSTPGWQVKWLDEHTLEVIAHSSVLEDDVYGVRIALTLALFFLGDPFDAVGYIHLIYCILGDAEIDHEHHVMGEVNEGEAPELPLLVSERYEQAGVSWPVAEDFALAE